MLCDDVASCCSALGASPSLKLVPGATGRTEAICSTHKTDNDIEHEYAYHMRVSPCMLTRNERSNTCMQAAVAQPRVTAAQRAVLCRKCGQVQPAALTTAATGAASSRRDALVATVAGVAALATAQPDSAAEAAAADAFEIPASQQCLECIGSGIVNCAPSPVPHRHFACSKRTLSSLVSLSLRMLGFIPEAASLICHTVPLKRPRNTCVCQRLGIVPHGSTVARACRHHARQFAPAAVSCRAQSSSLAVHSQACEFLCR